ncbi:MAG: hypothetical protein ACOC8E_03275 [Planctomycetota bacterium]
MINVLFPVLRFLDGLAAWLIPAYVRVWLWGAVGGAIAIGLYALLSDQQGIRDLKEKTGALRKKMLGAGLSFDQFLGLARENLAVSLSLLRKVLVPVLVSFLFVLVIAEWLNAEHSYARPEPGEAVPVEFVPPLGDLELRPEDAFARDGDAVRLVGGVLAEDAPGIEVRRGSRLIYAGDPVDPPAPSVHKKRWWNVFLASGAGYVRGDSPVREIRLRFRRKRFIGGVPDWLATWEPAFFVALFAAALAIKFGFRVR